jgi:archaellum component FlaC
MEKTMTSLGENNDQLQSSVEAVGEQVASAESELINRLARLDERVAQIENTLGHLDEKVDTLAKMLGESLSKLDEIKRGVPALLS